MKNNFFSIIITTYNSEDYILNTLKSVFKQTYKNYEIILVDDCSEDRTLEIVKKKYKGAFKIYKTLKNFGGPAKSRNLGIKFSSGDWIAFLDGDDYWFANKLEIFNQNINNFKYIDIFCSNEVVYNKNHKIKKKIFHGPYCNNFFYDLLINGNKLSPSAAIIKKELIKKYDIYFDESNEFIGVEDYDYWLKLSNLNAKFFFINKCLNIYVLHKDNITNNAEKHMINTINVIKKNMKLLNKQNQKNLSSLRLFSVKISFLINEILKKNNLKKNIVNLLTLIITNPLNFFKFSLNKIK